MANADCWLAEMTSDELKARSKQFALRCLEAEALPKWISGKAVARQLVRAGTSVAANYRASCRAHSPTEFTAKLWIIEEKPDECAFWLELAVEAKLPTSLQASDLQVEGEDLVKIITASRITASRNRSHRQLPDDTRP